MADAVLIYALAGVAVLLILLVTCGLLGACKRLNRILERVFGDPDYQPMREWERARHVTSRRS